MKDYAKKFYKSKAWKQLRATIVSRDGGLCVDCMKKGLIVPAEEVHHIIELTPENINDPDIVLNADNLVSLCRECHRARHGEHERRYEVDDLGRVRIK